MFKRSISLLLIAVLISSCDNQNIVQTKKSINPVESLISKFNDSKGNDILVVAHRAGWRNTPENSIQGINYCIEIGVDMIEIDVRETKDGKLILMHDRTIDRTTNGTGYVKDWTLDSLKTLRLKDGQGYPTPNKIPTLKEALIAAKGKILINLDKSYEIFDKCYQVALETNTVDQIIVKGNKEVSTVKSEFGEFLDKTTFMPVIKTSDPNHKSIIDDYLKSYYPKAIEFVFEKDTFNIISNFNHYRNNGISVWVNSLWPHLCGDHDDEKAYIDIKTYDWYINNGVNIIQTDRPKILLDYLKSKGLHN